MSLVALKWNKTSIKVVILEEAYLILAGNRSTIKWDRYRVCLWGTQYC